MVCESAMNMMEKVKPCETLLVNLVAIGQVPMLHMNYGVGGAIL